MLTRDGDFLPYDALLIAVGARLRAPVRRRRVVAKPRGRVATWPGSCASSRTGRARSVAFVVPRGAAWPMDAYELAFVARLAAERGGSGGRVLVVTAESSPVEALGPAASEAVAEELAPRGESRSVTGVTGEPASPPLGVDRDGAPAGGPRPRPWRGWPTTPADS